MVDFLLDNTLGAWHAGKVLAANPKLAQSAESEDALRSVVSLPGCPWKYLRFIKDQDGTWKPAASAFDGWPKTAKELKCLDPCMGSGHFVVAMFERVLALRVSEERLDETTAVAAVIRDNMFGLEIDPRCTQIAAFNLALAAWRRVGHCKLPAMNLACSGLAPNTREADWVAIAGSDSKLRNGMERLYRLFKDGPVLGSLINPRAGEGDLLVAAFHELQPLLEKALAQETKDDTAHEMAVTARGLAKAAEILAGQFTLVATNVPYLTRQGQCDTLREHCERVYPTAKADLATCFVERSAAFLMQYGTVAVVAPTNWLYQPAYKHFRRSTLEDKDWHAVARLGPGAFDGITGEVVNVTLVVIGNNKHDHRKGTAFSLEATDGASASGKAEIVGSGAIAIFNQIDQLANPDARVVLGELDRRPLLSIKARSLTGLRTADNPQFMFGFWEVPRWGEVWVAFQSTVADTKPYGGKEHILRWDGGGGALGDFAELGLASIQGRDAWNKRGVTVSLMSDLPVTLYSGDKYDMNCGALWPHSESDLPAVWAYCSSREFTIDVRKIDQQLKLTTATLLKIPFDLGHWQKVAAEKYPDGLPKPFSSDPTQWLFNGHPAGADQPLHVAVARLLGYQWPRQTGSSFPDCPALGPDGLETLADEDGIVCLPPLNREQPAANRLRALLAVALGSFDEKSLLAATGSTKATLEDWLRDEFFEQHSKLFHHRPFLWQLWDGRKDGFSVLVNYHKLDHTMLQKLTYTYLGNWIHDQESDAKADKPGAAERLGAAQALQAELAKILEGEAPYDLFVRWKPLSQQVSGWHPDLNDGVRLNIRPFLTAKDMGKKGAGILRAKPNVKWDKDRGKEPQRAKADYSWFWCEDTPGTDPEGGRTFTGNRWNDVHLTLAFKQSATSNP
jgi:hypothetical protein